MGDQSYTIRDLDTGHAEEVVKISSLNAESLAFHRKNGFRESGRLVAVGRKRGADFDLVLMQRFLKMEAEPARAGDGTV